MSSLLFLWPDQMSTFEGHTGPITCMAFSPDSSLILSGSTDRTVRLWRVADAVELACFQGHQDEVLAVAFSTDVPVVSVSRDRTIRLWNVAPAEERQQFPLPTNEVRQYPLHDAETTMVVFSPDGIQALAAGHDGWTEKPATIWVKIGEQRQGVSPSEIKKAPDRSRTSIRPWHLSAEPEEPLTPHHDNDEKAHLLAFTTNGRLALFGTEIGEQKFVLQTYNIDQMDERTPFLTVNDRHIIGAFSPNGRRLLLSCESADPCGTDLKTLRLWNVLTGEVFPHQFTGHSGVVNCIAFSPDGCRALSGSDDQTVRLWDIATGRQLACFEEHTDQVNCVAFSPDGRRGASGSHDRTIRVWTLPEASF